MKYDEAELIEFFGILPSEQDPEEKEFFGTTVFDYHQNRYHLYVSFSVYRNDFYLDLNDVELARTILELRLEGVEEIKIRRDKPTSTPVLIVRARSNGEDNKKEEQMQAVEMTLEPNICIKLSNRYE